MPTQPLNCRHALRGLILLALLAWPAAGFGQTVCIKVPKANLRSGPGASFRVTWEVHRYMPLQQVGKNGEWLKVRDVDGDLHWVAQSVVTADEGCVTVKVDKATIRKAPKANAPSWFKVDRYTSFKRVGEQKDWVKLEHEGKTMWASTTVVWPG